MNEAEMLDLMNCLDKGTNMFGSLRPDIRSRLFAVVDNPNQETWNEAHSLMISNGRFITLWQACIRYAGYEVSSKSIDGAWPEIPTREQILTALMSGVSR